MAREFEWIPYQAQAVEQTIKIFEESGGKDAAIIVLPTGCGKTVVAGQLAHWCLELGRSALFLVNRDTLCGQANRTFEQLGLEVQIEKAGLDAWKQEAVTGRPDVVIGSVQTMTGERLARWSKDRFGLIVVDECHRVPTKSYREILDYFQGYWHCGITATPVRKDKKSLKKIYPRIAIFLSLADAIKDGYLVPYDARKIPIPISLKGLKTTGDEYNMGDLAERIGPHIEQIAAAIQHEAGTRKTAVFAPDVGSAMCIAQVLRDLPTPSTAHYVAGEGGKFGMPAAERNRLMESYANGEFQFIVSCDLLFEGWDDPATECAVIARTISHKARYTQTLGRALRRCPGKTNALILDFDWQADDESRAPCTADDMTIGYEENEWADQGQKPAKRAPKKKSTPPPPAIEDEEVSKIRTRLMIRTTGIRAKYVPITYTSNSVAKLIGVKLHYQYDLSRGGANVATVEQLKYLKILGIERPEGLSKWGATKLIAKLKKRKEAGLAAPWQVDALRGFGVDENLARVISADQAKDDLAKLRAVNQKTLF